MGEGAPDPRPTFVIVVDDDIVGWVDADLVERHDWLEPGEVNCGYHVFAAHRGRGLATRALQLLGSHLARTEPGVHTMTLLIDEGNDASLGVARRCGFTERPAPKNAQRSFAKPVPPLTYTDGVVTIRPHTEDDAAADLAVTDADQLRWLWRPEWREDWARKTDAEKLAHKQMNMRDNMAVFATGPRWPFAIEVDGELVGYVDCDLHNDGVPPGEANISYSIGPQARGKGHVSRAVGLVLRFLSEHTGAREAHIGVDAENEASLRVARAVGAVERYRKVDERGATMVRHVIAITR